MASSYSTDLKLELMVTGENAGTWGDKTNTNLNLLQQAIAGFESITITDSATTTLTMSDAAISNARNMVLKIATVTLSGATTLALPDGIEKFYILDATAVTNPTNLTFKTSSGTGFTLDAAKIYAAYSDGTNINEVSLDTLGGSIGSAQIADNAVTTAKISNANVTSAKIADNAVLTAKISNLQVTQAKIANDAVGPDQLSNTAVTAGEYSNATVTVDAQGRITAASAGGASAGAFINKVTANGPSSGTFTSNGSKYIAYALGAGGGGGGASIERPGGPGGKGGMGAFSGNITAPYSSPYFIGGGGGGGNKNNQGYAGNPGSAGGATGVTSLFQANGGNGAPGSPRNAVPSGSAGSAPGAFYNGTNAGRIYMDNSGGNGGSGNPNNGGTGGAGRLFIFDNTGS
jgi:hypothetical protein